MQRSWVSAFTTAALCHVSLSLAAVAAPCGQGPLDRERTLRCALAESLEVRQARLELKAIAGRRIGAGLLLPANPTVSVTAGGRKGLDPALAPTASWVVNWSASLSQELE